MMRCRSPFARTASFLWLFVLLFITNHQPLLLVHAKFNEEVVERVSEHLDRFMSRPREILDVQLAFRQVGGFRHDMGSADRDTFFQMAFALFGQPNTFYALEDGTFTGVASNGAYAFSKEAGNGNTLYEIPTSPDDPNYKYWIACVDEKTGQEETCSTGPLNEKSSYYYIQCVDDCKTLAPCPDADSQRNCSALFTNATEAQDCWDQVKYCPQYEVLSANFSDWSHSDNVSYGFVPRWYYCIDEQGRVTQEPGECFFEDDETPVQRNITGPYDYCEGKQQGPDCNPVVGNYRSAYYDARYRPFYTIIRDSQTPLWSSPGASFNSMEISYSAPIYSIEEETGRTVFDGVLAMDYDLRDITDYLTNAYSNTDIAVALFEVEEPHYIIASSTGTDPVFAALEEDNTVPCPADETTLEFKLLCDPFRLPMSNFSSFPGHTDNPTDELLTQAFTKLKEAGFPRREILTFNWNDDLSQDFYVTTVAMYEPPDAGLNWTFVVVMPGLTSPSQPDLAIICSVASFGAAICFFFLVTFLIHRRQKTIMMADWRFTCLFFSGCLCLNLVSFTLLGQNTDTTCLVRMWCFHMAFVATLSPLLAKCLRMRMLVSASGIPRRRKVTHFQTFLFMLPPILLQAVILLFFTFLDPPTATETLTHPGTVDVTQQVICSHNSQAFFILQIVLEGSMTLAGAMLAYHLRHVEAKFGESKQLVFAMSSILGVGCITLILSSLMGHDDEAGKRVLYAVGICWGTAVSCCAFALPRLLTVQQDRMRDSTMLGRSSRQSFKSMDFRASIPTFQMPQIPEQIGQAETKTTDESR